ncbi:MAG: fumarylacetoacetate hydrolase family protein [Chloroflexota bacterium]|nr:MAG: fumarylacetoacetate hydrolase family protein [Chloroflexota bacterium]
MKLLTFTPPEGSGTPRLGALLRNAIVDLGEARQWAQERRGLPLENLPESMFELIAAGTPALAYARNLINVLEGVDPIQTQTTGHNLVGFRPEEVALLPPLLRPMSLRDFNAFEGHVSAAFAIRGREVPAEWYQFPVFYFSNPNSIFGPGEMVPHPSYTQAMDYELEVACIISKPGINIPPEKAEDYIFGYTIFNDWSARDVQRMEMKAGLGPAKGKDFASSLGPWIVTPDELSGHATERPGVYDLEMKARLNGKELSQGNWKNLYYSFGQMIARASSDVYLLPGDVIGSGTVGTGCLLELTRGEGPWLRPGDVVDLEIESLGVLTNRIGLLE